MAVFYFVFVLLLSLDVNRGIILYRVVLYITGCKKPQKCVSCSDNQCAMLLNSLGDTPTHRLK